MDEEERAFIVKLEQEVNLSGTDIFKYVEQFEEISLQFSGEYIIRKSRIGVVNPIKLTYKSAVNITALLDTLIHAFSCQGNNL